MKLQTERINALADRIEQCEEVNMIDHQPHMGLAFSMRYCVYPCGAPACILGHNHAMYSRTERDIIGYSFNLLANDLGITKDQAFELCAPNNGFATFSALPGWPGWITKRHAVDVLRHLANTGEVDWSINKGQI